MNSQILIKQIVDLYQKLEIKQKIVIGISVFIVVGFLVFLVTFNNKSNNNDGYRVLFDNLSASDAALIMQQLEKEEIPYKLTDQSTIKVPQEVVYKERIAIASLGIPKNNQVGFELFDKQEFGATNFDKNIKLLRALEGELERTIEGLNPIVGAKVHIALQKDSLFVENKLPNKASIVLQVSPGMKLSHRQIMGIKNLVAASIPKLSKENVSLIDQNGETLGDSGDSYDGYEITKQIKYQKSYEERYEKKIINILTPILGNKKKIVANVSIYFSFAKKDTTSEEYDPESVARSEQSVEEKKEGTSNQKEAGGVPGAISNIGPVQDLQDGKSEKNKYTKNTATTNYEISKKVTNTKGEFAKIIRLSAAVVVDGKYIPIKDEEGNPTGEKEYQELNQTELTSIKEIIQNTVGYNEERGDQVSISNFEFNIKTEDEVPATVNFIEQSSFYLGPIFPLFKYLFAALLLFIFYKKIIMPFSKKMIETRVDEEEEDYDAFLEMDDDGENPADTLERFKEAKKNIETQLGLDHENFNEQELKYDVILERIREMVEEKPQDISTLITSLIAEETSGLKG